MINWPNGKKFALTIVDDTDYATVANVKPVYDYLFNKEIITTKTVWCYPSRDKFGGETLADQQYVDFIKSLIENGFEIAFHGAGSGSFERTEIESALNLFNDITGYFPRIYINHASNPDGIYWGKKRFGVPLTQIYDLIKKSTGKSTVFSSGDDKDSVYFWGDYAKKHIKYIRNRVYSGLNTLTCDPYMPYLEKRKLKYSNYWFSSSDGYNCKKFVSLLTSKNIDNLVAEQGCAIIYTHFAYGFIEEDGSLNKAFRDTIDYLCEQNGWFVPASDILDYMRNQRNSDIYIGNLANLIMDCRWICERMLRKIIWRV